MIFADFEIVNTLTNKNIKEYTNKPFSDDLLGPQYSGFFLYWASDTIWDISYQSSNVIIKTPKFRGMTWENMFEKP